MPIAHFDSFAVWEGKELVAGIALAGIALATL
jgi:hypothetical protein